MPCSRSARRPSVSRARSAAVRPRSRLTRSTAASWSDRTDFVSWSRRPTRVDLPSSTDPAVARRSSVAAIRRFLLLGSPRSIGARNERRTSWGCSEIALLLAVLHGGLGDPVVGTRGAALGQGGGGHLEDDVGVRAGRGVDRPGARHVTDGAVAHEPGLDRLVAPGLAHRADGEPHAVPVEDLALVGVVERRERDVLTLDVAPDVDLGPVADREDADVLARTVPGVEEVPQLGALVLRVPLTELVAEADDALLGARLLLVAPAAAEEAVEPVLGDRVEQRHRLERVPGAVGTLTQPSVVDVVLHARDDEAQTETLDRLVAVVDHLGEVVAGVDVQHREGDRRRPERLRRQVQHDDGVLATAEEQRGTLELAGHLADDEDRLRLEHVELAQPPVVRPVPV